ncbi:uncharacterized protein isoform X2 [Choristoneura fumiferana]|uniref:uncharacterized protein isoform X2 n=1 Tax=Choristoneura fumiferana TaxID=7141 RepID=UPI003D15D5B4
MHTKNIFGKPGSVNNNFGYLAIIRGHMVPLIHNAKSYTEKHEGPEKDKGRVEQIDKIHMPGFVHPENKNEEGYFTQIARQQLEELKKKMEKPKVDNTEKKD